MNITHWKRWYEAWINSMAIMSLFLLNRIVPTVLISYWMYWHWPSVTISIEYHILCTFNDQMSAEVWWGTIFNARDGPEPYLWLLCEIIWNLTTAKKYVWFLSSFIHGIKVFNKDPKKMYSSVLWLIKNQLDLVDMVFATMIINHGDKNK